MTDLTKKLKLEDILATDNVAELLPQEDLDTIGKEVVEGFNVDKKSREQWENDVDKYMDLALQVHEEKNFPWPNAASVKYPLLATAALQFSSRAYPALLPGTNLVRGRPIGFDTDGAKQEKAYRIGKHMSYQIIHQMTDWEEEMDRMLFALPIIGCMFKKTYYDPTRSHNVSEIIWPKELVVNYWAANIEDASRVTHMLTLTKNEVFERVQAGIFLDEQLQLASGSKEKTAAEDARQKVNRPPKDKTSEYDILEQHCMMDLDQDGYEEPYIITVDLGSSKTLRIFPRFSEKEIYRNMADELMRIVPINYFTKFSFIPSPDGGFYDIGFGILLGPINNTVNTVLNQLIDAGTMSNLQGGFIAKGLRIKGGDKNFTPGEWKYANAAGMDLKSNIVPLPVREPSAVLFNLLNLMVESGERLSSITEMMTGEIPGQNTKATVAMAAIEQGEKVFSGIYKRLHRALGKEFKKIFALNSDNLDSEEYFTVLDLGDEKVAKIAREDYSNDNADVVPASDPSVATEQQRLMKVQALGDILALGTINPSEYTKRYLEATEQPNVEALMTIPPSQPSADEQLERARFEEETKQAWAKIEIEKNRWDAESLARMAEAESRELGDQLSIAETHLKEVKIGLDAKQGAEEARLRQKELDNQQKGKTNE